MKRTSLLMTAALTLPLAMTACGGSDGEGEEDQGTVEGEHYQYVVATIDPRSTNRLDIDGNGMSENKLGDLVGILTLAGFEVQEAIDEAVLKGAAILLADVQTTSFSASATAGVSFYLGDSATAMPPPCTDTTMIATCGKHLAGTGTFNIAATSPRDTLLKGKFAAGTFKAGPGKLAIQIALTGAPITVNLISARAQLSTTTADGIAKGLVGGAISDAELNNNVLPAIEGQLKAVVDRDCGPLADRDTSANGNCSCTGATGLAVLRGQAPFDYAPTRDCQVSVAEIKGHPLLVTALKADIMVEGQPALSVGLGFTAKKATFVR